MFLFNRKCIWITSCLGICWAYRWGYRTNVSYCTGIALIIGLKWKDLLLHAFDPHQAKASGLNTTLLHYGLLCMIALTIVATLKSVGIILSISLLIAPAQLPFC